MNYSDKLQTRIVTANSHLCVGLDPRADRCDTALERFLEQVIEATSPYAAAFKPNLAYYEAFGSAGIAMMERILKQIPPDIPVILDAKRSDTGTTQEKYATALFDVWNADAVTLNPLMGFDTIEPFLKAEGKAVYLLGITSNPGAADFLLKPIEGRLLIEHLDDWKERAIGLPGEMGLVAGLNNLEPETLRNIPDWMILAPGFGAQGGSADALTARPWSQPLLINVSRGISYGDASISLAERANHYRKAIETSLN